MLGLSALRPGLAPAARAFSTSSVAMSGLTVAATEKIRKAGLPVPPRTPPNGYGLFAADLFSANREALSAPLSGLKTSSELGTLLGGSLAEKWNELSEQKKEEYITRGRKLREDYTKEFGKFLQSLQRGQLGEIERIAGKKLRFPGGRPHAKRDARDARGEMPKPLSGFFLFYRDLTQKGEFPKVESKDNKSVVSSNAKYAGAKWGGMSAEEKEPYLSQSREYRAKYDAWKAENDSL